LALAAALLVPAAVASRDSSGDGGAEFEVRITNLTRGVVFTPVLVAAHEPSVQPFQAGTMASVELEILAEGGDPGPLAALLLTLPEVFDGHVSDGPVPPGETATVRVRTRGQADHVSLLAMLVPTNDGFVALNTVPGPKGNKSSMFTAVAYDAGTEANSETCDTIPGPPDVCTGEGFNEARDDSAAYIHVHSGIHGIGDLDAAAHDWRNPVAQVVITRVPGDDDGDDHGDDSYVDDGSSDDGSSDDGSDDGDDGNGDDDDDNDGDDSADDGSGNGDPGSEVLPGKWKDSRGRRF